MKLVFATRNPGKLAELRELVADLGADGGAHLTVLSLEQVIAPHVLEDGDTFAANAIKKAREVGRATGLPALADDSGLEVDALDGAPGVYSARYAGEGASDDDNNQKLLAALAQVPMDQRGAQFHSVLAFADPKGPLGDDTLIAEGICPGVILCEPRGTGGFGYDPLFYVPDLSKTFAELGIGTKNHMSHRARAMRAMRPMLEDYFRLDIRQT